VQSKVFFSCKKYCGIRLLSRTGGSVAVCGSDVGQVVVIATSTNQLDIRSQLNFVEEKHKQYCSFSQLYFIFAIEINVTKLLEEIHACN
jgi:hypothetical protein